MPDSRGRAERPAVVHVVEDDAAIGSELEQALTGYGHDVTWVRTGAAAMPAATSSPPDLVLLDLGLPDIDGVVLCRRLRAAVPEAVIVVLTARSGELDVVIALDAGADDYLTKPVRLAELLARIRAHLRRRPSAAGVLTSGRLRADLAARRVRVDGAEVRLRPKEFDLLVALLARAGEVVTREQLMATVWEDTWFGSTKTLDVHVSALRSKLAAVGLDASVISTIRGRGYRLAPPT